MFYKIVDNEIAIAVKVKPNACSNSVVSIYQAILKLEVCALPENKKMRQLSALAIWLE